jgi:hypothetical protein
MSIFPVFSHGSAGTTATAIFGSFSCAIPFYHRVDTAGQQLPYIDEIIMTVADGKLIAAKDTGRGKQSSGTKPQLLGHHRAEKGRS